MFKNKSILITGGTGSFGNSFVDYFLKNKIRFKKIIIFSRDEFKQFEMRKKYSKNDLKKLRFFLGDIRDKSRLKLAFNDVDIVIHAAALKHVPVAEYNPIEFIKTNIIGSQNITEVALETNVKKVVSLSTDKACSPINLYGATKLCADKLFLSANNIKGKKNITFSVVRYGNVFSSRGSVIPEFLKQKENKVLKITHKEMTRFNIFMNDAIKMVLWAMKNTNGGEIIIPKLKSYKIIDLAKIIGPDCKISFIGIRPGEKIHETLISNSETSNVVDIGKYYIMFNNSESIKNFLMNNNCKKYSDGHDYSSNNLKSLMSIKQLKKIIIKEII
jgi:UDP-N-acetylglucosamine 4,6-dehydratase (inverting)